MTHRQIHFLAYLNRSGSTLLAKKLDEFKDISVGIEFNINLYIQRNFYASTEKELDYWLEKVYKDIKFKSWNIKKNELRKNLLVYPKPIYFKEFSSEALNLYFKNDPAKLLIHKGLFNDLGKVKRLFPSSKQIFIDRDPRAIFNSQKKSISSIAKQVMRDDVVKFAVAYKRNQKRLEYYQKKIKYKNRILIIRYENLLLCETEELQKVLDFFNVSGEKIDGIDYYSKIPIEQRYLHKNLNENKKFVRINAWKNELQAWEIDFLNFVLKRELKNNTYETKNISIVNILNNYRFLKSIIRFWAFFYPRRFLKEILIKLKVI